MVSEVTTVHRRRQAIDVDGGASIQAGEESGSSGVFNDDDDIVAAIAIDLRLLWRSQGARAQEPKCIVRAIHARTIIRRTWTTPGRFLETNTEPKDNNSDRVIQKLPPPATSRRWEVRCSVRMPSSHVATCADDSVRVLRRRQHALGQTRGAVRAGPTRTAQHTPHCTTHRIHPLVMSSV